MNCEFELKDNVWVCNACGRKMPYIEGSTPVSTCNTLPSLPVRIAHYAEAIIEHVTTGMKSDSDEAVKQNLEICQNCDKFNHVKESCSLCGCRCNLSKSSFLNKLRMKTQSCPLNKW